MATTDLKFDEPGSLPRPGPIGRLARLAFAALCLWYVWGLVQIFGSLLGTDSHIRPLVWNGIMPGLFLVSYVINIGYSRAWKKWPAIISGAVFLVIGGVAYLTSGSAETIWLATAIWVWALYLFTHLGLAFLVSAVIGTPGCEMRAFHDLYSRLTGVPTKEHYCPVGPLHPIDRWEARRTRG
ncbi:MAG: hypothetical protein GWP02_04535 [Desulfobulbaceae bacterium]|nr:hypothetical protein [Desulfobulbaceae bacterium]